MTYSKPGAKYSRLTPLLACVSLVAACGGGGGSAAPATAVAQDSTPASATPAPQAAPAPSPAPAPGAPGASPAPAPAPAPDPAPAPAPAKDDSAAPAPAPTPATAPAPTASPAPAPPAQDAPPPIAPASGITAPGGTDTSASGNALTATSLAGQGWYVDSAAGNDANAGTIAAPWKTLARAMQASLAPTDAVLLKCGGVWQESITVGAAMFPRGGGTVGIYGSCTTDSRPIVSGANSISSLAWAAASKFAGKPVFAAKVNAQATQIYWNGAPLTRARLPNYKGIGAEFSLIKSAVSGSAFVLSDQDRATVGNADLAGASVTVRTEAWKLETLQVKSYASTTGTLTLAAAPTFALKADQGYYIEGHAALLDAEGEWLFDPADNTVYVYLPGGANPQAGALASVNRNVGMTVQNVPGFRVDQLRFDRHGSTSVSINASAASRVTGVVSSYARDVGIAVNSANVRVEDSFVSNAGGSGVSIQGNSITVTGNTVINTGIAADSARPQAAINVVSPTATVTNNRITASGYTGITVGQSPGVNITGNEIYQACLRLSDCGGIYAWGAPTGAARATISYNVIRDLSPNTEGAVGGAPTLVAGVYLDEKTANYDVRGNMMSNIGVAKDLKTPAGQGVGINLHNSSSANVSGNTVWAVSRASVRVHSSADSSGADLCRGIAISGNTLFSARYYLAGTTSLLPSAKTVYAEDWVHYADPSAFFSGADPNSSRNNVVGTVGSSSGAQWAMGNRTTGQQLDAAQWAAYGSAEEVRLQFPARLILPTLSSANLVQNASFATPSTPWQFYQATPASLAAAFGTCPDGTCANITWGSASDSVNSNEFKMVGTAGDNLYMARVRAQALTPGARVTARLHRLYGDWASVGFEQTLSLLPTEESRVEVLFLSSAAATDRVRLDLSGNAGQSAQLREASIYKLASTELFEPWTESAALTNGGTGQKAYSCADAKLRSCNAVDMAGQPVQWPVLLPGRSATVLFTADAKWKL